MANAPRDENLVTVRLGTSNLDGLTTLPITADPATHCLEIDDGNTGSDLSDDIAPRDQNLVTAMLAVSSADGQTPVQLYVNASGQLLIDSS